MNTDYNAEASKLLDEDHPVVGVSDFGDEISDHCAECGFALGWRAGPPSTFGHTTLCSVGEVQERLGES